MTAWTGGLVGERDAAQPLLTLYDGPARVELSGATTANWVAKSANLLVDGLGAPDRIGLLLPLHWQTVALLLAGVTAGATVVLAEEAAELAGCGAAFTTADVAEAALDAGVDEVLALSCHPLGARLPSTLPLVLDYATEVPGYGDHWGGPRPTSATVLVGGSPVTVPDGGLGAADRVLLGVRPGPGWSRTGAGWLLAALGAGAGLVLVPDLATVDLPAVCATERVTCTAGADVDGLPRLDR